MESRKSKEGRSGDIRARRGPDGEIHWEVRIRLPDGRRVRVRLPSKEDARRYAVRMKERGFGVTRVAGNARETCDEYLERFCRRGPLEEATRSAVEDQSDPLDAEVPQGPLPARSNARN